MSTALALLLSVSAAQPPLIPRAALFATPARESPSLSPGGALLAWLAPAEDGTPQLWLQPLAGGAPRQLTREREGLSFFLWSEDGRHLLFTQDVEGDENHHLFSVEVATGKARNLTPFVGARATLVGTNAAFADAVWITLNLRDRSKADLFRLSLKSGALTPVAENPGNVFRWHLDAKGALRGVVTQEPDGATLLRVLDPEGEGETFRTLLEVPLEENVLMERMGFVGFSRDGRRAFLTSPLGADTLRVLERALESGAERILAEAPQSDVVEVLFHPTRHEVEAAAFVVDGKRQWRAIDPAVRPHLEAIARIDPGVFSVVDRDRRDRYWLVEFDRDTGPRRYYLYERAKKRARLLFSSRPELEAAPLAPMRAVSIRARDGLALPSFLTLPKDANGPQPMVLLVHGGPWGQDTWGFRPEVQWLANRGYAVLQVNFRASSGFGKTFLNAGNRRWDTAMQEDLVDAVRWAISEGHADPERVAIMGSSYGGYAALAGAAFHPELYACAVDAFGISNLLSFLGSFPPQWAVIRGMYARRVGSPEEPGERERLQQASPLFSAARIRAPILIAQGANDPRVRQAESEQMVAALRKAGRPVTYVLYPDEGHGFAREENRLDYYARVEAFLARHLGGRAEPAPEGGTAGSSAQVAR